MQELRLVGVQEDGGHLLLSSEQGVPFRLPIDDALRRASASAADAPPLPAPGPAEKPRATPARSPAPPTPREIQARIRAGASAEQIAEESGVDLARVQRYEGPVRAEREYVAYLAQRVEVASPLPGHDGYRSAFGDEPASLGEMVALRVREFGVDASDLTWDAWRRTDGSWHVEAAFELPDDSRVDLGEQPPATWSYNPTRKTVTNANRWAQVLSELEPLDGPLPSRRLSAVADRVFDFEADTRAEDHADPPAAEPSTSPSADRSPDTDQDDLLDVLRSRRGQRLDADEDGDDALALLLTRGGIPAAHPREEDVVVDGEPVIPGVGAGAPTSGQDDDADQPETALNRDGTPRLYDGVSTDTREISIFAHPARGAQPSARQPASPGPEDPGDRRDTPDPAAAGRSGGSVSRDRGGTDQGGTDQGADGRGADGRGAGARDGKDPEPPGDRRPKPKRSSVPSWDDIVFGRRSD